MPKLKIASVSCNQTGQDWSNNLDNILLAIDQAVIDGADFLCFEELTLTGYECGDNFAYTDNKKIHELLQSIADYAKNQDPNLVLSVGHPWRFSDKAIENQLERRKNPIFNRLNLPFNVQTFISQGKLQAMSAKRYLFNYERGYEKRHFEEWSDVHANHYHQGQSDAGHDGTITIAIPELSLPQADGSNRVYPETYIPFGSPVIKVGNINVVHEICEELWIGSRFDSSENNNDYGRDNPIAEKLAHYDIQLVLNPNGSPPAPDKVDQIKELVELNSRTIRDHITVYTDGLGSSGSTFAQTGFRMMAQGGEIKSQGTRLSFKPMDYTSQVFEVSAAADFDSPVHAEIEHNYSDSPTPGVNNLPAAWEEMSALNAAINPEEKEAIIERRRLNEELRHETLWLFDYLRKNKLKGFTQAVSGGADSAYNGAKVRIMIELATNELGNEGYLDALPYTSYEKDELLTYSKAHSQSEFVDKLMEHTLTSVYLSTPNNSMETRRAAESLICGGIREDGSSFRGIGGKFYAYDIQPLVNQLALLYTGLNVSSLPKERLGEVLSNCQNFLGLPPDTASSELQDKTEAFKQALSGFLHTDNAVTGPVLSTADPAHGLTIENMQARIRQVIILMITNFEKGKIGLANPNLDEICNAYTSFGGDEHSGQIALNAHKPKAHQLTQMRLLEEGLLHDASAVEGFYWILKNKPSAELQPKSKEGDVTQYDEDALGRTFLQTHIISYYMLYETNISKGGRKNNPTEVLEKCMVHPAFAALPLETVHDMVILSYKNWGFAQHKIHAFPIAFTYGQNVDHQSSLRTPNISGNHQAELSELAVYTLARLAEKDNTSIKELTGFNEAFLKRRVSLDAGLAKALEDNMWTAEARDGRKRKVTTLYQKIKQGNFNLSSHLQPSSSWSQRFFAMLPTWAPTKELACETDRSFRRGST